MTDSLEPKTNPFGVTNLANSGAISSDLCLELAVFESQLCSTRFIQHFPK